MLAKTLDELCASLARASNESPAKALAALTSEPANIHPHRRSRFSDRPEPYPRRPQNRCADNRGGDRASFNRDTRGSDTRGSDNHRKRRHNSPYQRRNPAPRKTSPPKAHPPQAPQDYRRSDELPPEIPRAESPKSPAYTPSSPVPLLLQAEDAVSADTVMAAPNGARAAPKGARAEPSGAPLQRDNTPWSLAPSRLLEVVEPRLRVRAPRHLLSLVEDLARAQGGVLLIDAALLHFVPAFAITEEYGQRCCACVKQQVDLLLGRAIKELAKVARFQVAAFDRQRGGFFGGSRQGGIAAVPMTLLSISAREELVLTCDPSKFDLWPPAKLHAQFLQQIATLCRGLSAEEVPTLSQFAAAGAHAPGEICVSVSHESEGGHPLARPFEAFPNHVANVMHALQQKIKAENGLAQFLAPRLAADAAVIPLPHYEAWCRGETRELFCFAWPIDLQALERVEAAIGCIALHRPPDAKRPKKKA